MEKNQQHPPNKGNEGARQPDPETLGTTDPQEHMKGPISSFMQGAKHVAEKNNDQAVPDKAEKPANKISNDEDIEADLE